MNKWSLLLTRFFLLSSGRSFEGAKKALLLNGEEIEIVLYSTKSHQVLGQLTVFNTIVIDKALFEKYSKTVQDYVLLHEYGHKQFHRLFSILAILISIPATLSLFMLLPTALLLASAILTNKIHSMPVAAFLFASELVAIGLCMSFCWLDEILADFYAIKNESLDNVKQAWVEIKQKHIKKSVIFETFWKILIRLTHPPHWLTLRIYNFFVKH